MKFDRNICAGMALAASALASPVLAQDIPGAPGAIVVTGGVDLVSDYRFRGVSLSGGDVAVQPTITISHDSGFYVGAWGSNLEDSPVSGDVEVDLYGGYSTEIASGTTVDVSLTYYWYPDGEKAFGPSDYFETIAKLSHTLGPVEATGSVGYSWDQAALGGDSVYVGLDLSAGIPNTPVTLTGSVGYTDGALGTLAPGNNYLDWSLGASAVFGPVTAGVRYIDTDIPKTGIKAVDKSYGAGLIFSLGVSF